jgi:hypothetical protein
VIRRFAVSHASKRPLGRDVRPRACVNYVTTPARQTSRQTVSNGAEPQKNKTPDLSEVSISRPFLIAGAGFEPATFGL